MQFMEAILNEFLKAVLAAAIPILAGYLVAFIQSKSKALMTSTNSAIMKDLIAGVDKIVVDAVSCTDQTFVDDLKKAGKFDAAAAKEAFEKSKDAILKVLPQNTKDALALLYSDVDAWLDAKIESTVKNVKTTNVSADQAAPITSVESSDTTEATKAAGTSA